MNVCHLDFSISWSPPHGGTCEWKCVKHGVSGFFAMSEEAILELGIKAQHPVVPTRTEAVATPASTRLVEQASSECVAERLGGR